MRGQPDGIAEEMPHGTPLRFDSRFPQSVRRKPGAMHALQTPCPIGDRGDQRRSGGRLLVWPSSRCQHFGWKRRALIHGRLGSGSGRAGRCRQAYLRPAQRLRIGAQLRLVCRREPWPSFGTSSSGRAGCGRPRCARASARRSGKREIPVRSRMMSRKITMQSDSRILPAFPARARP